MSERFLESLEEGNGGDVINIHTFIFLEQVVSKINRIIDKKWKQWKKDIVNNIIKVIDELRILYYSTVSYDEKMYAIEQVLASVDYLFSQVDAKKLFVRNPRYSLNEFLYLSTEEQIFEFMLPKKSDIADFPSVLGGNCYTEGVLFYYNLLKEIVWNDKYIKFKFHILEEMYHWTLSINGKFWIDSDINKLFFEKLWKHPEKTNFYRLAEDEKLGEILKKLWVNYTTNNIWQYIKHVENLPDTLFTNVAVWGKGFFVLEMSKKLDKISCSFHSRGVREKRIEINVEDFLWRNIDEIINFVINEFSLQEEDKATIIAAFSKIDRNYLERLLLKRSKK